MCFVLLLALPSTVPAQYVHLFAWMQNPVYLGKEGDRTLFWYAFL